MVLLHQLLIIGSGGEGTVGFKISGDGELSLFLIGATEEEEGGIGLATYFIKVLLIKTPKQECLGIQVYASLRVMAH